MNSIQHRHFIHYDPERTDFTVTPEELIRIESAGNNLWKDVFLVTLSLSISCIINAAANISNPLILTLSLFLNSLIGMISLFVSVISGIAWWRTHTALTKIIEIIKNKPKLEIVPKTTNIGELSQIDLQQPALKQKIPTMPDENIAEP